MRGNTHAACGGRAGETDWPQGRYRAPVRPNLAVLRDVEELVAERGIEGDHTTLLRWVARFTPLLTEAARPLRHTPGDRWCVDGM